MSNDTQDTEAEELSCANAGTTSLLFLRTWVRNRHPTIRLTVSTMTAITNQEIVAGPHAHNRLEI